MDAEALARVSGLSPQEESWHTAHAEWQELLSQWFAPSAAAAVCAAAWQRISAARHGDWPKWWAAIDGLPAAACAPSSWRAALSRAAPELAVALEASATASVETELRVLMPWRKGPFQIAGISLDAEWRCDLKWERLRSCLELEGKRVLDVGSGNGYYCLRALGDGATCAVGVDPTWLYVMQFLALRRLLGKVSACVLPLTLEALPEAATGFDAVFSLGVLYHQREPLSHLRALQQRLHREGELALETLVIEGGPGDVLVPRERYAGMRNVWALPSAATVELWLQGAGFRDAKLVDVSVTTPAEQRATSWSAPHSLRDVLDPHCPALTVEGYPAPRRALWLARP